MAIAQFIKHASNGRYLQVRTASTGTFLPFWQAATIGSSGDDRSLLKARVDRDCLRRPRARGLAGRNSGKGTQPLAGGVATLQIGSAAAFLLWPGGYVVVGWLVMLFFSAQRDEARQPQNLR